MLNILAWVDYLVLAYYDSAACFYNTEAYLNNPAIFIL